MTDVISESGVVNERNLRNEIKVQRTLATEFISKWCFEHGLAVMIEEKREYVMAGIEVRIRTCVGKIVAESKRHIPDYDLDRIEYIQSRLIEMTRELGLHLR